MIRLIFVLFLCHLFNLVISFHPIIAGRPFRHLTQGSDIQKVERLVPVKIVPHFPTFFAESKQSSLFSSIPSPSPPGEPQIITLLPSAETRLTALLSQSSPQKVLRMGVKPGGCSGLSYTMDFVEESTITEDDTINTFPAVSTSDGKHLRCIIDSKSVLYLYGMKLDYSDALIGGGFQFHNPNAEKSCGCGKSFGV